MARSSYIYHVYRYEERILSGTVKHEVLLSIYNNNWTGSEYYLTCSGDNSEGESEVLGWRPRPKEGDDAILIDGFLHEIKEVLYLNPSGTWTVKLLPEHKGTFVIKWNPDLNQWEQWEKSRKPSKKREAS